MAWDNAVVTNAGIAMLQQALGGATLTLDGAAGGTGTVAAAALMAQTALVSQKQTFSIVGSTNVTNGKKVNILVASVGLAAGYTMNQVGIWAHVGEGASALFAILQDETGIPIPSGTEMPDFALNFYAIIDFSNESEFALTVDPSALVSVSMMNVAIAGLQSDIDSKETPAGAQDKATAAGSAAVAAAGAYTDQEVGDVQDQLDAHLAEVADYDFQMFDKDATTGMYFRFEEYRADASMYRKTILSNPDVNGYPQTETQEVYDTDGATVLSTETFALVYDADGMLIQRDKVVA